PKASSSSSTTTTTTSNFHIPPSNKPDQRQSPQLVNGEVAAPMGRSPKPSLVVPTQDALTTEGANSVGNVGEESDVGGSLVTTSQGCSGTDHAAAAAASRTCIVQRLETQRGSAEDLQ
ncbi:hypothetical protein FOZ62_021883, partial [Perkinsus olseni]